MCFLKLGAVIFGYSLNQVYYLPCSSLLYWFILQITGKMQLKTKSSLHPEDPSTKVEYKEDSFITEYTGNVMCITGIH